MNDKDEVVLLDNADRIKALEKMGASIQKYVTDFDYNEFVKKYVTNGGYNIKKTLKENFQMLIQVLAMAKANNKI